MAKINQVNNILNLLMSMYRGTTGLDTSTKANDYTWKEFTFVCGTWSNSHYFTWG